MSGFFGGKYTEKVLCADYYRDFACKCGDCRHTCCDGWGICVSKDEYFRLLGLECSKALRHKLDCAFELVAQPDNYRYARVIANFNGDCPMLAADGYCSLQREKGEGALPTICRVYPRCVKNYGSHYEICASNSCEKTVELLFSSSSQLSLIKAEIALPYPGIDVYGTDAAKDAVRMRSLEIISDRSISLSARIAKLCGYICGQTPPKLQESDTVIDELIDFIGKVEDKSVSILHCGGKALEYIGDAKGEGAYAKYRAAEKHLYSAFPDIEIYAEKLIANHMLYESFPYVSGCGCPAGAFSSFCFSVALLKFICVCDMAESTSKSKLCDIMSELYRFVEHSGFYSLGKDVIHPDGVKVYEKLAPMID